MTKPSLNESCENLCDLCGKNRGNYIGLVWYHSDWKMCNLCKSCHFRWYRSKECKSTEKKHKKAKPTTKQWERRCKELQKKFNRWFEVQSEDYS